MTALLQEEPAVRQAYDKYLKFNSDARMRALDEAHQRFMHDQASELEAAIKKGKAEGLEEGFAIGETRGKAEAVLSVLRSRFQTVPQKVESAIRQTSDPNTLDSLIAQAAVCESLDDFASALK